MCEYHPYFTVINVNLYGIQYKEILTSDTIEKINITEGRRPKYYYYR